MNIKRDIRPVGTTVGAPFSITDTNGFSGGLPVLGVVCCHCCTATLRMSESRHKSLTVNSNNVYSVSNMVDDDERVRVGYDIGDREPFPHEIINRKRGILTETDREYLMGGTTKQGQDRRNLEFRMRQRIEQSMFDMVILAKHLPHEEMRKIGQSLAEQYGDNSRVPPLLPSDALVYFTYDWIQSTGVYDQQYDVEKHPHDRLQIRLMDAILNWEREEGNRIVESTDVTINVEYSDSDIEDIRKDIITGNATALQVREYMRKAEGDETMELIEYVQKNGPIHCTDALGEEIEVDTRDLMNYARGYSE